jgi:hypothetical protein
LTSSLLIVIAAAGSCPYINYETPTPNPDSAYTDQRSTVVKTPGLLRDPTKNAFLGTMGPCGNDSLYQSYLYEGEMYHCDLSSTIVEWAAMTEMEGGWCTWGYGELAPPGDSTNPDDYMLTTEEASIVDTLGEQSFTIGFGNILIGQDPTK